jgi:predicted dehydrogenase
MKSLVIGYGSIGKRHSEILKAMGHEVFLVTKQNITDFRTYDTISKALKDHDFSYVVISSKTSEHEKNLKEMLDSGFSRPILVEKPLFKDTKSASKFSARSNIFLGYNLRFHPALQALKQSIQNEKIYTCNIYCGQYLPLWRKSRTYTQSYSTKAEEGGGVLRDLSHELDYALWLFGDWVSLISHGGHFSHLEGSSEDAYSVLLNTKNCSLLTLHVNYLDRIAKREIVIQTEHKTIHCDLIAGTVKIDEQVKTYAVERNYTYQAMHTAALENNQGTLCNYASGLEVVSLIEKIEESAQHRKWIENC